jgi:hypothetical protein
VPSVWIAFAIGPFASIHVNMLDLPANPLPHQGPPKLQSNRMFPQSPRLAVPHLAYPISRSDFRYTRTSDFKGSGRFVMIIAPFSLKFTSRAFNRQSPTPSTALNLRACLGTRRRGLAVATVSCVAAVKFLEPSDSGLVSPKVPQLILSSKSGNSESPFALLIVLEDRGGGVSRAGGFCPAIADP